MLPQRNLLWFVGYQSRRGLTLNNDKRFSANCLNEIPLTDQTKKVSFLYLPMIMPSCFQLKMIWTLFYIRIEPKCWVLSFSFVFCKYCWIGETLLHITINVGVGQNSKMCKYCWYNEALLHTTIYVGIWLNIVVVLEC